MLGDANAWLLAASVLSLITMLVHVFAGGPEVAAPVNAATELTAAVRATNYYCWHIVTITIGGMAVGFSVSALSLVPDLAILATGYAIGFTVWNVALIVSKRLPWLQMGQWALFGPIAILGVIGLA